MEAGEVGDVGGRGDDQRVDGGCLQRGVEPLGLMRVYGYTASSVPVT
jgi:hypothetical protein